MPAFSAQLDDRYVGENDGAVHEWMPPKLMARYQFAKLVGATFFVAIFAGWLVIQWSNPAMRIIAGGLLAMTVIVTWQSHVNDARRARCGRLRVYTDGEPTLDIAHGDTWQRVLLSRVDHAVWRNADDETLGLWLYDGDEQLQAHIDADFVAHEPEARKFLAWLRGVAGVSLKVSWPAAERV